MGHDSVALSGILARALYSFAGHFPSAVRIFSAIERTFSDPAAVGATFPVEFKNSNGLPMDQVILQVARVPGSPSLFITRTVTPQDMAA